ncbi:response regulator containing a CheY-like receiver domain and an HD-GYP domain [Xenococcus sp. PCC 7305]|uniref:response regulator n=1 Tax=Xenococcus sp. PCC 7305 TaxID=102125 RepID=UPI0002AD18AB|nr:response regulator [Xenococcus sp. PCC 7305]ELS03968.1 response regulator containing a CheY-like receiver domain and an HD-GYP domain [Xenococcus sp. PCC 7305]
MSSKLILFIDDEEDIQTLVSFCFDLEIGWQLITASSGEKGIALATVKQPDAILLDAMMPELDGLQTLELLQKSPKTRHIPVIFITAKAQASDRRIFYNAGAKGVIVKPFDSLTLTSQISGFLGWETND